MSKGRLTSYRIRKTFAHALELELYNLARDYSKNIGKNVNEVMNKALVKFLKEKGVQHAILNIPENIDMFDGVMKCMKCADSFKSEEEALRHECVKMPIPEAFTNPPVRSY